MGTDKATRLAAIRAANEARKAASSPAAAALPTDVQPAAAATATPNAPDAPLLAMGMRLVLGLLVVTVCGLLVMALLAIWGPLVAGAAPELRAHTAIAVSRSSSFVAYALLWLAMAFGLALSGKVARIWPGGPLALDLHQHLSLLSIAFTLAHVLSLLGETSLGFNLAQGLMPFVSNGYRPMWMGMLGKVCLYLMTALLVSTWLKQRIGARWWRRLHYLSFAAYLLGLTHAIFAGSDTGAPWALALYSVSAASLLGLGAYRLWRARAKAAPAMPRPAAPRPTPNPPLQIGAVALDLAAHVVTLGAGRRVDLRPFEAQVLACLLRCPGQSVTADQILAQVWGPGYVGETLLVRGYIRRLRAKLEPDPVCPRHIIVEDDLRFRFVA